MKLFGIFTISIFLLLLSPNFILAQGDPMENPDRYCMDAGDGRCYTPPTNKKTSNEIFEDFLDIFFKPPKKSTGNDNNNSGSNGSNSNNSGSVNNSLSPVPSTNVQLPNLSPLPTPQPGNYIMHRQCDYKSIPLPDAASCSVCFAGCGPSAVSNIVANLKDRNANPKNIIDRYYGTRYGENSYLNCNGSSLQGAITALKKEGFSSEILFGGRKQKLNEAIPDLIRFTNSGAWILAGGDFWISGKTVGHFFVITQIVPDGNGGYVVYGLDSTFGDRNNAPINYTTLKDFQVIKFAAAVRP